MALPVAGRSSPARIAGQVRQAAALLRAAGAAIDGLEPVDVVHLAPLFADAARVAEAATLRCAHTAGDRGARRFAGERSAASLLSTVCKTSLGKAKAGLDAAEKLRAAPAAEQALWRGELSLDQASTLAPLAAEAPAAADTLVETAKRSSMKQLKEEAAQALRRQRDEASLVEGERRIHRRRYCRTWIDSAGGVRLEALLAATDGASVLAALGHEAGRLDRECRRAGRDLSFDQLRADALVRLLAGRRGRLAGGSSLVADGGPPSGADRGGSGATARPNSAGPASGVPQVLVRVDAAALRRGATDGDETCEIAGVGPVSVRVARELLCDGFLTLLVTDGVDIRTVTSTTRTVPARVEKALLLRDIRCVVPGCGATEGLEIDHWRKDFSWRGQTELTNLCRLCPAHHAMKTRTGWRLSGGPGRWRWLSPKTVAELARAHVRPDRRRE